MIGTLHSPSGADIELVVRAFETGRFEDAVGSARMKSAEYPGYGFFWKALGSALWELRQTDLALSAFDRALWVDRSDTQAWINRGVALHQSGRSVEALASYDRGMTLDIGLGSAYYNRGVTLGELRRQPEAIECYRRCVLIESSDAGAWNNLGNALRAAGNSDGAANAYHHAVCINPGDPRVLSNAAGPYSSGVKQDHGLSYLRRSARVAPEFVDALGNLGGFLRAGGFLDESFECLFKALALDPVASKVLTNLGASYRSIDNLGSAQLWMARSIFVEDNDPNARSNLGTVLLDQGCWEEAARELDLAISVDAGHAGAHLNRAQLRLLMGDFHQGWSEFEWRWAAIGQPRPDGHNIDSTTRFDMDVLKGKTLVLQAEQGYGDTLQFCRYARLAVEAGATTIMRVPEPLVRLLNGQSGMGEARESSAQIDDFDYLCPMLSLPMVFGTTLETIPFDQGPYLTALPEDVEYWHARLDAKLGLSNAVSRPLRVGLVWSCGFRKAQPDSWVINQRRNIPLGLLLECLDIPDITFISLQQGLSTEVDSQSPWARGQHRGDVIDFTDELTDFAKTAGLIANLDIVVSVDTSTAHLAAAMGKPTWILNRHDTCWRWLLNRSANPWYPSVTLYRQSRDRDWRPVLQRVAADLVRLARDR